MKNNKKRLQYKKYRDTEKKIILGELIQKIKKEVGKEIKEGQKRKRHFITKEETIPHNQEYECPDSD